MAKNKISASESTDLEEKKPEDSNQLSSADSGDEPQEQLRPPLASFFDTDSAQLTDDKIKDIVTRQVLFDLSKTDIQEKYNLLFLFDESSITRSGANRIYDAVSKSDKSKSNLLMLSSPGGDVAAAYFIAKLCRDYTDKFFEVAVPRQAKSAATLICCGADRIHMGSLSELGPIDPQFDGVPALALKHSVEHLAQLAAANPYAAEMFSSYLAKSLRVEALGYYERVAKSATHYASRLLNTRRGEIRENLGAAQIANRLVYEYTDHGFVIDSREATEIFSDSVVVCNTPEYKAANSLYQSLDFMRWICSSRYRENLSYIGGINNACWLFSQRDT